LLKLIIKTKSKNYPVFIGKNSLDEFRKTISKFEGKILFLIDKNVNKKCSGLVEQILSFSDSNHHLIIDCNEKSKSLKTVERILHYLVENKFDRGSMLVSVGGGVLGDITGFAASIFMRGIKYYQIPTTILSAVDSSVGGKTGVNFQNIKNLVGTFYQPNGVFINNEFFNSLPRREIISGIGELVKYAFIVPYYYEFYRSEIKKIFFNKVISDLVIKNSIKIKSEIVKKDEKEEFGLRKILNLGHTFAHGFESASNYKLKHGEAVFWGVFASILLSIRIGLLPKESKHKFIEDFGIIPISKFIKEIDISSVINFMRTDKKNIFERIHLVLPAEDKIFIDFPIEERIIFKTLERFKEILVIK
jgi:3-dehydroquinate synthase